MYKMYEEKMIFFLVDFKFDLYYSLNIIRQIRLLGKKEIILFLKIIMDFLIWLNLEKVIFGEETLLEF